MVYSTSWFILSLALLFVFVFFSPFNIAIISLGEERAGLYVLCVCFTSVGLCLFPLSLGVRDWLQLVIVALPRLLYSFVFYITSILHVTHILVSSSCAQWIAKDPSFLHAHSKDSAIVWSESLLGAHAIFDGIVMRWLKMLCFFMILKTRKCNAQYFMWCVRKFISYELIVCLLF